METADRVNTAGYIAVALGTLLGLVATLTLTEGVATGAAIAAATLVVLGSFAIFWASAVRNKRSDQMIATANVDAARANERTASLELKTTEARVEQERLKALLAWRRLTANQHETLIKALKEQPVVGEIWVSTVKRDPEAILFAQEIAEALRRAGLNVKGPHTIWQISLGLGILPHSSPERIIVEMAFKGAGLPLREIERPQNQNEPRWIEIVIGSKPEPF